MAILDWGIPLSFLERLVSLCYGDVLVTGFQLIVVGGGGEEGEATDDTAYIYTFLVLSTAALPLGGSPVVVGIH